MPDKNIESNENIDSSNIFDEFVDDTSLIDEVDKIKKERNRDLFFYISKTGNVLQTVFWLGLIVIILLFSYIYIQNDKEFNNSNLLDPFCSIFLGDIKYDETYCSSISIINDKYAAKLAETQKTQVNEILNILEKLYLVENFTKSKEVLFLEDRSQNKLKTLSILEEFDNLKNNFNSVDKQKIQCDTLVIDSNRGHLTMKCTAYSAGFEKGLRGFDGSDETTLKGTSISMANSFLNFIAKQSSYFTIIDRQKIFKTEMIFAEKTDFTNRTPFSLKLKYNLK